MVEMLSIIMPTFVRIQYRYLRLLLVNLIIFNSFFQSCFNLQTQEIHLPFSSEVSTISSQPPVTVKVSALTGTTVPLGTLGQYKCEVDSDKQLPVKVVWSKEGERLPPARVIDDGSGSLVFVDGMKESDSGIYTCTAVYGASYVRETLNITVLGVDTLIGTKMGIFANSNHAVTHSVTSLENAPIDLSEPKVVVMIPSPEFRGAPGDIVRFQCFADPESDYRVTWSRQGNQQLPANTYVKNEVLVIYNVTPADSGIYVCSAVSETTGKVDAQSYVTVTVP